MSHCPFCNYTLEEFIFHEGALNEPATTRLECFACGPVEINEEVPGSSGGLQRVCQKLLQ